MSIIRRFMQAAKPAPMARLRFVLMGFCVALNLFVASRLCLASPPPVLGANLDLAAIGTEEWDALLDRLVQAGVSSIRVPLNWNQVQPQRDQFEWALFDSAVEAAVQRDLSVVFILGPCADWAVDPTWEVPESQKRYSVPQSLRDWRSYVRTAVERYRGKVGFWQVRKQPNSRNFRGARREYLALLQVAAEEIERAAPEARLIVPESGRLDLAGIQSILGSRTCHFVDAIGVYVGDNLDQLMLQWAVLTGDALETCDSERDMPIWVLGAGEKTLSSDMWHIHYLIAWAFGAECVFMPPEAIYREWTTAYAGLEYVGFWNPAPTAWVFAYHGASENVALGWAARETDIPEDAHLSIPSVLHTETASNRDCERIVKLGIQPTRVPFERVRERISPGAPNRDVVISARGTVDYAGLPMIYADFSMPEMAEFGLSNRALRTLRGGAVVERSRSGRTCLATQITYRRGEEDKDNPWIYFDVDNGWLYFDRGQSKLAITVECEGGYMGKRKLGFNILYDSVKGYRFTPWQWVDPGYGWHRYRFVIDDADFANRDGYDFRINAKGSKQDLHVCAVSVERLSDAASHRGRGVSH